MSSATISKSSSRNVVDEIGHLRRGLYLARIEGLASLADAAHNFLSDVSKNEPISASSTIGDALRGVPQTIRGAVRSTRDQIADVPSRVVDKFYNEYRASRNAPSGSHSHRKGSKPEQLIIDSAQGYLNELPSSGALLTSLVDHVVLDTGYDEDVVKSTIVRHFVTSGAVVRSEIAKEKDPVVVSMQQTLSDLGYDDVRQDHPLTGIADVQETAALVAFDQDEPVVVCYPVERGLVQDPMVREAARFQAASVVPDKSARYIWISDGDFDYFFDGIRDSAIPALPGRSEWRSETAKAKAKHKAE